MKTTTRRALIVVAMVGLMGAKHVKAASLRTPPIQPGAGQKLVCTVVNVGQRPLQFQAQIVDRFGGNITEFLRTDWNADETVVLTLRAESNNPNARYCRITVSGARKRAVEGSLQACTYDETACGNPVVAR